VTDRWRPLRFPGGLLLALPCLLTCATANPNAGKYPPRAKHCQVRVFYSAVPEVKEWDDLGMASVDCALDVGGLQCLARLRSEACRMGGDLLYDVPKKPLRPTEQGMSYRGHVAHTRRPSQARDKDDDQAGGQVGDQAGDQAGDQDRPPADSGPVEPISPLPPAAPTPGRSGVPDGGTPSNRAGG
jgi:hypothetical protein